MGLEQQQALIENKTRQRHSGMISLQRSTSPSSGIILRLPLASISTTSLEHARFKDWSRQCWLHVCQIRFVCGGLLQQRECEHGSKNQAVMALQSNTLVNSRHVIPGYRPRSQEMSYLTTWAVEYGWWFQFRMNPAHPGQLPRRTAAIGSPLLDFLPSYGKPEQSSM